MNILVIEDEALVALSLMELVRKLEPSAVLEGPLVSVQQSIQWLKAHPAPDLVLCDIQLADGIGLDIFINLPIDSPIIFTTAFDEYAIRAFKLNSIDYLLKPIGEEELKISLEKYKIRFQQHAPISMEWLKKAIALEPKTFQERFMVNRGEKLLSVPTEQIAYFEGEDRYVYLVKKDGSRFIVDYRLSDLEVVLNPNHFFRLNRSFITHITAIHSMVILSKSRIKIELNPAAKREIMVSSENSQEFKQWLNQ